jgi:uracil-DNA glycosylase
MKVSWKEVLSGEKTLPYFTDLMTFVHEERTAGKIIYPAQHNVFNALKLTPLDQVKVVILGQDPYHGPNQAHGLCFSVLRGVQTPPSLLNIFKELVDDQSDFTLPQHGDLSSWAEQGVLLLNTVLTVEQGRAHSHANRGWETFTDKVIDAVNEHTNGTVFLLWGSHAQKKQQRLDKHRHYILSSPHPSPLSAYRGFFGCGHFSKANELLSAQQKAPINWCLPE